MPLYEYECHKCGERFELRRNISDNDGEIRCPECGAPDIRRRLSIFAAPSSSGSCGTSSPT
ncbi:MAG: zinc ribbon domain-containing protein [Dehalococcoidales bacterium]|nr:zinc ribbon domain-containing protein [Dehalococcoidales bacterium]